MQRPATAQTLLAPLLLLPLSGSLDESLAIELPEGTELRTTLELVNRLEIASGAMRMLDRTQEMPDEFRFEIEHRIGLELFDRFPSGAADAEAEVLRTFVGIEDRVDFSVSEGDREAAGAVGLESELEGVRVRFVIEDGERRCRPADEEESVDEDLLESLRVDCGGWALLPTEAVEVGDGWTLEGDSLRELLMPGGLIRTTGAELLEAEGDDADDLGQVVLFLFAGCQYGLDEVDGELALILEGIEDGVAEVRFEGSLEGGGDQTELAQILLDSIADDMDEEAPEIDLYELATVLELEGSLRWNLEAGRADGLEWTAEIASTIELELTAENMPGTMQATFEFEGTTTLELDVE